MPTQAPHQNGRETWLLALPAAVAVWLVAEVLRAWIGRWAYDFDLEWMEGGVLAHAWRAQHLEPIYVRPGPDFVPMVYTPGYYYVVGALAWVFELGHPLGRAVSMAGTTLAAAALVWLAKRRFDSWTLGWIGVGAYLGCYGYAGAFFDLVRPDALAVGLLAWATVLSTDSDQRVRLLGAASLWAAFVVKHNMAAFGVPLALGIWAWHGWRAALAFGLSAALPGLLFTVGMQLGSDGHFLAIILDVPRSHPFVANRLWPGLARETGSMLPVTSVAVAFTVAVWTARVTTTRTWMVVSATALVGAATAWWANGQGPVLGIHQPSTTEAAIGAWLYGTIAMCVLLGLANLLRHRTIDGPWTLSIGFLCVAAVVSGTMRAHHGGFVNVFMPLLWTMAAALVVVGGLMVRYRPGWWSMGTFALLATAQLGRMASELEIDRLLPTEEDVVAGEEIVEALRGVPGPVLSPFAPWIPVMAGHRPGMHLIALWDIRHREGPYREDVATVLRAMEEHHWGAILDATHSMAFGAREHYEPYVSFPLAPGVLLPPTGWRRRPSVILVPRAGRAGRASPTPKDATDRAAPPAPDDDADLDDGVRGVAPDAAGDAPR